MYQSFRLYWARETGCDAGTPLRVEELEPEIRRKVLELARSEPVEIAVELPYMDQREWRKRGEILAALPLQRRGNIISGVLSPGAALRTTAANLALIDPVWKNAPRGDDPRYFADWRKVSAVLQRFLRDSTAEQYFRDISRFENRDTAFPMIVYQAARVCRGRSRGDFTYDLRDYPECRTTLALALKMTGLSLQGILEGIEQRLQTAGMPELARRYSPVWYQDVIRAVRLRPRLFLALLTAESAFINGLVELGLNQTPTGVNGFSKLANRVLRKVHGMDLRPLGIRAMEIATRILGSSETPAGLVDEVDPVEEVDEVEPGRRLTA